MQKVSQNFEYKRERNQFFKFGVGEKKGKENQNFHKILGETKALHTMYDEKVAANSILVNGIRINPFSGIVN